MRPVNLLPLRYRQRSGSSGDSKTTYVTLGALAVLLLAVFGYVMTANKVSSRNSEIAQAQQQITAAEAQTVTLKGFGDFAGVKEARLAAVKSLATTRLDWERLFRELAHVLPDRVWLTGFNAQAAAGEIGAGSPPALLLKGCAGDHRQIADVMIRLRSLNVADDVELSKTAAPDAGQAAAGTPAGTSDETGCGEYYSFEITVAMALPTPSAEPGTDAAVPARLGGGE
jgi:Tfp pilus assembly protein PilN